MISNGYFADSLTLPNSSRAARYNSAYSPSRVISRGLKSGTNCRGLLSPRITEPTTSARVIPMAHTCVSCKRQPMFGSLNRCCNGMPTAEILRISIKNTAANAAILRPNRRPSPKRNACVSESIARLTNKQTPINQRLCASFSPKSGKVRLRVVSALLTCMTGLASKAMLITDVIR